jgi:hypothetical protein
MTRRQGEKRRASRGAFFIAIKIAIDPKQFPI